MLHGLVRRTFTMPKFVTHEAIASDLLNLNHCSASGVTLPWQHHLTNTEKVLDLMVRRMETDWTSLKPQMRKAWDPTTLEPYHQKNDSLFFWGYLPTKFFNPKVSSPWLPPTRAQEALQKVCGGYLACVEQFVSMVPSAFANSHLPEIEKTFLDTVVINMVDVSTPNSMVANADKTQVWTQSRIQVWIQVWTHQWSHIWTQVWICWEKTTAPW